MKRYISDLHLFHNKILELTERPYKDVLQMHFDICNSWRKTVSEDDTVYILGDVGMYHEREIANILERLPGKKILVTGNHDKHNLEDKHFRSAFSNIKPYLEVWDEGRKVVLFHYPIEEWDGYFRNFYHLHGHVHNKDVPQKPHRYNVCLDAIGPAPLTLDEIIGMHENADGSAVYDADGASVGNTADFGMPEEDVNYEVRELREVK